MPTALYAAQPQSARSGLFAAGQPYLAYGAGPPLVMLRGLTPSRANPAGLARWSEQRFLAPLARYRTVYAVSNPPALAPGLTMAGLVADTARRIRRAGLVIYRGRGHRDVLTDPRLMHDIVAFLQTNDRLV